jgi:transcriptional regulator with XRE-family HTH domain
MAEASGVSAGILSQIERGLMFPADRQTARIEEAYGATVDAWYSPRVLLVLEADPEDDHG